jgi:Flp pilus assembly protein TadG
MKLNRRTARGQKGFAALYVLFASMLLIPVAGLAIDFSVLYNVKGRLQAAVDAAAISAGYKLQRTTDLTDPTQVANIQDAAQRFFNANYPSNYWGTTQISYSATPTQNASKVRTLNVQAVESVPMLFMRVIGINNSKVAAQATVSIRYVNLMIVVDRSGSVSVEGANTTIVNVLNQFVATRASSIFVDGRDVVGMVSFGASWKLDFAPSTNFQSGSPNIGTAINNLGWGNNGTNTAEGLYQAWYQLRKLNQPGALNVILLLTDGRPSAFTGKFTSTANCLLTYPHSGVIQSYVTLGSWPFWPPPTSGADVFGVISSSYQGLSEVSFLDLNSLLCSYATQIGGAETNLPNDIPTFPNMAGPVDNVDGTIPAYTAAGVSTVSGYYNAPGNNTSNPRSVRYASFNVADNIAKLIRQDTVINPVMFVIGLTYGNQSTEPLDGDWLARLANDPDYKIQNSDADAGTTAGNSVFQAGQTQGWYYQSDAAGLQQAFQNVASQILRLSQ